MSPKTFTLIAIFLIPSVGFANELSAGDTSWILTSTALVLFMTLPGLALFYGGLVRSKNIISVLMQCFTIACLVSVVWSIYGYSLAFKGDGKLFGDFSALFLSGVGRDSISGTIPETVFVMFQMTFAIITPALVVGAFAERMKFSAVCLFSLFWITFVYLPACHMVWGGGFLGTAGVIDFAGGLVVHLTCGVGALIVALVLGPRQGFPKIPMPPHNRTMVVIGAAMLWVGWFGFNAGSALGANEQAGNAMLVTQIATAASALSWMFVEWIVKGKPTVLGITGGAIAGLVAITPASGFVYPMGALIIGLVAGVACWFFSSVVKTAMGYDDSFDVFGIHGVGGIVGALLTGVFCVPILADVEPGMEQLGIQFYGILLTIGWCGIGTFVILKAIDMTIGLRVSSKVEKEGLDVNLHGEVVS